MAHGITRRGAGGDDRRDGRADQAEVSLGPGHHRTTREFPSRVLRCRDGQTVVVALECFEAFDGDLPRRFDQPLFVISIGLLRSAPALLVMPVEDQHEREGQERSGRQSCHNLAQVDHCARHLPVYV